jgi:starch phosphorylase
MNEGHSSLLTLALLEDAMARRGATTPSDEDAEAVRRRCVFTTHTPIPAGHDRFPLPLVRDVLGERRAELLQAMPSSADEHLNMTYLGLHHARYANAVSKQHRDVASAMYLAYHIQSITNGVDAATWTSPSFQALYDRHIPPWRADNLYLRHAITLPRETIRRAHAESKVELLATVERRTGVRMDRGVFTIGFARRAAAYKRADMLTSDPDALRTIAREVGPIQIIYAGKAHPRDEAGKAIIRHVFEAAAQLGEEVPVVYLEEHDMALGRQLCAGVDLWVNTPQRPLEASGTSGMKAALNGVPSLSILDGWWVEGWVEGATGWTIGDGIDSGDSPEGERRSLYNKLAYIILPMYYGRPEAWAAVMRSTIAINGSYFNAQRMVLQYLNDAYGPPVNGTHAFAPVQPTSATEAAS